MKKKYMSRSEVLPSERKKNILIRRCIIPQSLLSTKSEMLLRRGFCLGTENRNKELLNKNIIVHFLMYIIGYQAN